MALSLDDVVFGIYDAYKTTEDEQIKQGILKKRVHPDDFSASLKEQLKGLSDDELLSVSELLKEKLSNSNINDIVYAQNGVVNINIPQSMINQGIDNAKFRRRGVSGVSLENKPIVETIIETAGTATIASFINEYIKGEEIQDLFGGMDIETANKMSHSLNVAGNAAKDMDLTNNEEARKVLFSNLPCYGYLSTQKFKSLSINTQITFLANSSTLYKNLNMLKSNPQEFYSRLKKCRINRRDVK